LSLGTLTKQGLDFIGASYDGTVDTTKLSGNLLLGMATCHNLKLSSKGLLVGNHVDHNMFIATGTALSQSADGTINVLLNDGTTVKVLKRFEFDHHRMTQSVIIQRSDGTVCVFVKGSGESVERLCLPKTIPEKFHINLENAAKQGIYQISLAMKELIYDAKSVVTLSRDNVENGLTFVGFINFKNQLREDTADVLGQLEAGDVISSMVTGDNTLTGINIAREAGLIKQDQEIIFGKSVDNAGIISWVNEDGEVTPMPSVGKIKNRNIALAVTGKVWATLNEQSQDNALSLAPYIRVFGRCTPLDKVSVIESFVNNGTTCCMVGDGGNDCGALKTAHIGIALSDAEASIVAPFTSLDKSITSVVEVLKEGRCALASALASYKYMIIYGQVESINQIANAYFSVTFHEWCWVFMDGIWMMSMAFSLSLAHAETRLSPKRPTSSLL
jgi:Cation transport ATPase